METVILFGEIALVFFFKSRFTYNLLLVTTVTLVGDCIVNLTPININYFVKN